MKKIFLVVLVLCLFLITVPVSALTQSEVNALILQIQQQIAQLQAQLQTLISQQAGGETWCHTFDTNLGYVNSGTVEVAHLHTALTKQGISFSPDAGNIYAEATALAVKKFQEKYASEILTPFKLAKGTGYTGKTTRAKLNALYACQTAQTQNQTQTTCTPSWYCGNWTTCDNGQITRTCADLNKCGTSAGMPSQTQSCSSTATKCTTNQNCQDKYKNCYYSCSNSQCVPLNTFIALNPYPDCSNVIAPESGICTPSWQCEWSACENNLQSKICYDLNNCGTTAGKPIGLRGCSSQTSCTPDWSCGSWGQCYDNQRIRTCTDTNRCGITSGKPETTQDCSNCVPEWQCDSWSTCADNQQIRMCTNLNGCGDGSDKPIERRYCTNGCQSVSIPGIENIKCVYGLAPYNTDSHIEMNYNDLQSTLASLKNLYSSDWDCSCVWFGTTVGGPATKDPYCNIVTASCDFTKIPNELEYRTFTDYCYNQSAVDVSEVGSRMAKGEALEQAYQNTIENQKKILLAISEQECVSAMVDEYYIGGQANSPYWMCAGEKYRKNPNNSNQWQKWVNGAWTTDFDWNNDYTCQ